MEEEGGRRKITIFATCDGKQKGTPRYLNSPGPTRTHNGVYSNFHILHESNNVTMRAVAWKSYHDDWPRRRATCTTRARRYYLTPAIYPIYQRAASPDAARLDPRLDRGNNDRTMGARVKNLVASRRTAASRLSTRLWPLTLVARTPSTEHRNWYIRPSLKMFPGGCRNYAKYLISFGKMRERIPVRRIFGRAIFYRVANEGNPRRSTDQGRIDGI